MAVKRIIANVAAERIDAAKSFYGDALGLRVAMDHGWIMTFEAETMAKPQVSVATEGGSGTRVPDLSIEVDDIVAVHDRMRAAGFAIEYGLVDEPWHVTRFFVRDPFGRCINVMEHR